MAVEIGTPITFDVGPAVAALDRLGLADVNLRAEVTKTQTVINSGFADAARQATAYSDSLARQQMEVRNATAATQSAREALRQLTEQQRDYIAAQSKLKDGSAEYQRLQRLLDQNKQKIAEAKQAINENKAATDQERAAVEKLRDARRQATNTAKEEAGAARDAAAAAKQSATATEGASKSTTTLRGVLGMVRQAFFAAFAVEKIVEVGEEVRRVTAEFEKYEITLTGAFNGDQGRAQRALIQVRNFADANGLEITQLTDTYVKLVNRGIIPTTEQLRQLSDIAATSGKSTDQFVEALLDAQTGEFERLKEFGIKVKNNGDTISFSFRGVKTEVRNTQEAISQYLFALGDAQGVQGQAAAQLKSLGGAAADSKNAFTELFQVIGERSKSVFGTLSNGASGAARALASYFKSSDQIALEKSAEGIDRYAKLVGNVFDQVAANTKAAGGNVDEAVKQAADDQVKFIEARLNKARAALANYYKSAQAASAASGGEVDAVDQNEVARYQTAIKLYEGQREAAQRAYKASVDGAVAEKDELGRIAELRKKIAAEEKARDAAPDTTAGNKERVRLVAQLVADNKLLNELLGKQDKAQQAINNKLAAALRALEQERATLTGLAAKAAEKQSDDATERARLAYEEQLRQIEVVKQKLIERERAVRAAGGRGRNADGVIDGVQQQQINTLQNAAQEQLTKELARIERERAALLLSLQKDGDQKELDQLEAAFNEQVRLHINEAVVLLALEDKYERDRQALLDAQATKRAQHEQKLSSSQADATSQVFGVGTGQSFYEAQFAARQQQLDSEKTFAEKRLDILKDSHTKEADEERAALAAQLLRIRNQQIELDKEVKKSQFSIYKLVLGEKDGPEARAAVDKALGDVVSTFKGALDQMNAAQLQAAQQRVQDSTQRINELDAQIALEVQRNQNGNASNLKGLSDQLAAEKQIRRQAIQDQKDAAKQKVIIDAITQASAIATTVADIFAATAYLNVAPGVGFAIATALSAAVVGAFIASKAEAFAAANSQGQGFFKGGFTGGSDTREERGVVHGKEFVHTAEVTDKYRFALFEPLHKNRPQDIDWRAPELAALLPDFSLSEKVSTEKAAHYHVQQSMATAPLEAKLDRLHDRLSSIESSNDRMADEKKITRLNDNSYLEQEGKNTKLVRFQ